MIEHEFDGKGILIELEVQLSHFVLFSNFTKLDLEKNFRQHNIQLWHVFHGLLPSKIYHFARSDKLEFRTVPGMYDKVANIGPRSGAQAAKHGTLICYRKMAICYQLLKNDFTFCWIDSRALSSCFNRLEFATLLFPVLARYSVSWWFHAVMPPWLGTKRYWKAFRRLKPYEKYHGGWWVETLWSDDIFMFCGHELLILNAEYQKIFMFPTNETTKYIVGIPRYEQIQARF